MAIPKRSVTDGDTAPSENEEGLGGRAEGVVIEGVSCCVTSLKSGVRRGRFKGRGFSGLEWEVECGGWEADLVKRVTAEATAGRVVSLLER